MKILTISDVHSNENDNLYNFLDSNDLDLVIISGDITNFGPVDFVESFIGKIIDYGVEVIAIPGNCDIEGVSEAIEDSGAFCIHNDAVTYDDVILFGFGGSNETPFDTPGEFTEEEIYDSLKSLFIDYKDVLNDSKLKILITHAPPLNTNADLIEGGVHVGSESISKIIQEFKPDINLCGHIHEAVSKDFIGNTKVLNPGMLENNGAIFIDTETNKVDLISLE